LVIPPRLPAAVPTVTALVLAACGGTPAVPSASSEAVSGPTPKVSLTCEVVALEAPPGGVARETVVSRPRITTLVGRPATIESTVGATPSRGERRLIVELAARTAGPTFDLEGQGRLHEGERVLVEAATDPDAAPAASLDLRLGEAGAGEAWEVRCQAGEGG
jgi:hypothetical protein